mmetsp:Transcript_7302/g.19152  ORF Transcript_7302/g.19152 Transcript_7302/m.19152 type:complete len:202 (-) Transcript_7302:1-606(-)
MPMPLLGSSVRMTIAINPSTQTVTADPTTFARLVRLLQTPIAISPSTRAATADLATSAPWLHRYKRPLPTTLRSTCAATVNPTTSPPLVPLLQTPIAISLFTHAATFHPTTATSYRRPQASNTFANPCIPRHPLPVVMLCQQGYGVCRLRLRPSPLPSPPGLRRLFLSTPACSASTSPTAAIASAAHVSSAVFTSACPAAC